MNAKYSLISRRYVLNSMKINRYIPAAAVALLIVASACGGKKEFEEAEESQAEIEAAMMQGRTSAREFVNKRWNDTIELMRNLLDAKSVQSQYLIQNKPRQAEAFDSGFIRTVRAVDPGLAATIEAREPILTDSPGADD